MRHLALAVAVTSIAVAALAQPVTIGRLWPHNDATVGSTVAPRSFIDILHPARGSGSLTQAVVYWESTVGIPTCSAAFTLQFLRPQNTNILASYEVFASRGPFAAQSGQNIVTLIPAVSVGNGDLIAITANKPPSGCGNVKISYRPTGSGGMLMIDTDLGGPNPLTFANLMNGDSPQIFASTASTGTVGYVPAAGAVAGGFGSFFRTSLQLTNNLPNTVTGKLVFHPQATSGNANDPSLAFTIGPAKTISYADVVTQIGASGLGSIDIVTNNSTPVTAIARTFNDLGTNGTLGFLEEVVDADAALQSGQTGFMAIPSDPTTFRMNLGYRTLDASNTAILLGLWDANGNLLASASKNLDPNWFDQNGAANYFNRSSLPPNGFITAQIFSGSAIVYASITDNRTNDSAVHYFRP